MDNIVLISAPEVLRLPIEENNEPLVDLHTIAQVRIDTRRSEDSNAFSKVRRSIAEKLVEAQQQLPSGIFFLIVEGYRPLSLQKEYFNGYSKELRAAHPDWDEARIYAEASKYVAPPDITPPHSTGGAIDLTLCNEKGEELDTGTRLNASPEESNNGCFTNAENISDKGKANRKILIAALSKAGFVNYPTEWWHWSYGDRYWAFMTKAQNAIYGSVKE